MNRHGRLTAEQLDEQRKVVATLLRAGKTIDEIATAIGRGERTAFRRIREIVQCAERERRHEAIARGARLYLSATGGA